MALVPVKAASARTGGPTSGDEKVHVSVVVQVGPGCTNRPHAGIHDGARGDSSKQAVAIVAVEQTRAGAVATDVEVQIAVVIEVHPCAALTVGSVGHDRAGSD